MKIVKDKPEFKPVSIILESQDELNWAYELFGSIHGSGRVRDFADGVYFGLQDIAQDDDEVKVFQNSLSLK